MEAERNLSEPYSPLKKKKEPAERYENCRYTEVSDLHTIGIRQKISKLYFRKEPLALMSLLADIATLTDLIIKIYFSRYSHMYSFVKRG
jgi:hypothetical protein